MPYRIRRIVALSAIFAAALVAELPHAAEASKPHLSLRHPGCLTEKLHVTASRNSERRATGAVEDWLARQKLALKLPTQRLPAINAPEGGSKLVRNTFSGAINNHETDNFVIWWGNSGTTDAADAQELGNNFEIIWRVQIEEMGYPAPVGSDTHKFNVYLGDTGPNVPSAEGNAGYFWYDTEHEPMVVISGDLVASPLSARLTAGHEFFHAVQHAVNTYQFNAKASWWFEATANWVLEEVFPGNEGYASTLYAVAMRPDVSLNHFGNYDTEGIEADHHYGAFIFATFLSEFHGGPDIIKASWVNAPIGGDPMEVIDELLITEGSTLTAAHLDYALHNATWDYNDEAVFEYFAADDSYTQGLPSQRIAGTIAGTSPEWIQSGAFAPQAYGANYWRLTDLPSEFTVEIEGSDSTDWGFGIATQTGTTHTQLKATPSSPVLSVTQWAAPSEAWLVFATGESSQAMGTSHPYQFRISRGATPLDSPAQEEGAGETDGGCRSVNGMALWGLSLCGIWRFLKSRQQPQKLRALA